MAPEDNKIFTDTPDHCFPTSLSKLRKMYRIIYKKYLSWVLTAEVFSSKTYETAPYFKVQLKVYILKLLRWDSNMF